jgi:LCP family protein required for cell wall assembly
VTVTPTSELDGYIESPPLDQLPGQVNILLLGSDARGWSRTKRWFRTDTIILLTLNWELGTANLLSFPRDLFLNIPGHGQDRINTAYQYGGFDLLRETFKQNFGVNVDHYVIINFENFKRFVDELGGLEVNVEMPLEDYRNGYWTSIPAGKVYMDADTVLWYARSRKTSNDFARNKRQQEVLQAIVEEVLTLNNIRRAPELYDIYKESVTTDLEFKDILPMLPLAVKLTDTSRISHYFISPKMTTSWITPAGAMVLLPNFDLIRKVIRKSQNLQ